MATLDEDSRWKGHHLYGDNYFDPKNDPPLLVIHVTEPLKEGSGLSAHTTYLVTTTVFASNKSYCTRRRYKEFKKLFEEMTKLRGVNLSSFPKKKLKKFDDDIVEERRLSFEIILREMADHHQIVIAPLFRRFVEVPLNVNVFPSDFNINSYTARRRSTITSRDQPKHQSISKKAPPPPPPSSSSSSQSSVNQLTSEQMVTVNIPPPPQHIVKVKTPSPKSPVKVVSPVSPRPQTPVQSQQLEEQSPVSSVKRNSQSHQQHLEHQVQQPISDPSTPVIILSPTAQQSKEQFSQPPPQQQATATQQPQQPIDVSTFIEEMRMQHQNRQSLKSPHSNPTSPVVQTSEPVKELDEDIIEVRQVPLPPKRKSQDQTLSTQQYHNSRRMTEEEPTDYSTAFRPMVVEDEAVDQTEQDTNFNVAMLNLGAQPIRVQARMSANALHTPYHQIKRDSITSKLADIDPEQQVQEILRQIKGESNVE